MTIQLFIPPLGAKIKLAQDWQFRIFNEYRNCDLLRAFGLKIPEDESVPYHKQSERCVVAMLPVGTELTIRRIYIRQGQDSFDSVTFAYKRDKKTPSIRFWVKLDDANKIVMEGSNGNDEVIPMQHLSDTVPV